MDKPPGNSEENKKFEVYEGLTLREQRERLKDPKYLPSTEEILKAFPEKESSSESKIEWEVFCQGRKNPIFEMINEEFVQAFCKYLGNRLEELKASEDNPVTILEVGAGNGKLSHFIREGFSPEDKNRVNVIATDDQSWGVANGFNVELMDQAEAIEHFQPDIVISSWMPFDVDWTPGFRKVASVQEYILIGEVEGCCGSDATWGVNPDQLNFDEEVEDSGSDFVPEYEKDGFEWNALSDISQHQIGRTDTLRWIYNSASISFKRKKE